MTAQSHTEASTAYASPPTFDLRISDPAAILNEIARRYESPERILMEFVDNGLDDAEVLYRANAEAYPFEIRINVTVDVARRYVTVIDNCRGMRRETLERIIVEVADSQKKGNPWVNGQFGFGVHAFRAAASSIRFRTKHAEDEHIELHLRRDQHRDIRRPWASAATFPTDTGTGTEVTVGPFDEEWFENVSADSIRREIERHFERLLARPNLTITVCETGGVPARCEPFDYALVSGEEFARTLDLEVNGRNFPVEVHLKVSDIEVPDRVVRFFARGRRINDAGEIKSFIRKSLHRTSIWGHPHLLGYMEVGEIVRPVITRDDFQQTKGRTVLYDGILALESEIKAALNRVNETHRDNTLNRLEDVLRDVLNELSRADKLLLRSELAAGQESGAKQDGGGTEGGDEGGAHREHSETGGGWKGEGEGMDGGPDRTGSGPQGGDASGGYSITDDPRRAEGTKRKRAGFDIKFGNYPPDTEGKLRRSRLVDGVIYINTAHTDFSERLAQTRTGRPRFTDRLGAYLAATVSIHYKDQFYQRYGRQPERADQMFDDQVEFMCRLEAALRPRLPELQQEFGGGEEAGDE